MSRYLLFVGAEGMQNFQGASDFIAASDDLMYLFNKGKSMCGMGDDYKGLDDFNILDMEDWGVIDSDLVNTRAGA